MRPQVDAWKQPTAQRSFSTNVDPGESSDYKEPKYILRQLSSKVKYEDREDVSSTEGLQLDD